MREGLTFVEAPCIGTYILLSYLFLKHKRKKRKANTVCVVWRVVWGLTISKSLLIACMQAHIQLSSPGLDPPSAIFIRTTVTRQIEKENVY